MDRVLLMQHLVEAERHVTEGEYHVRRQRDLVEKLSKHGHDTRQAEVLLAEFEQTLTSHKFDRDRMRAELLKL